MTFVERVLAIVAAIPRGRVASYGQIARLAGFPGRARHVGHALAHCSEDGGWHRVLNAAGRISHGDPEGRRRQTERLRADDVVVHDDRVNLRIYGWQPGPLAFMDFSG